MIKNRWLITRMMPERSSWAIPEAVLLFSKNAGRGTSHSIRPMDKYMRIPKNTKEAISRAGRFPAAFSAFGASRFSAPLVLAWYPAFSTAEMTSWGETCPSTVMSPVRRFTEQSVTPGTDRAAFSTRALQAAQVMPFTL